MNDANSPGPTLLGADEQLTEWLHKATRLAQSAHVRRHIPPTGPLQADDVLAAITEAAEGLVVMQAGGELPDPAIRIRDRQGGPEKHTTGQTFGHKVAHALGWRHG